jgi:outer membrane protein assembly factor BamB
MSFGNNGLYAFDPNGNLRWKTSLGGGRSNWGHGASPIVHGEKLLINAGLESGQFKALNRRTGEELWSTRVGGKNWATPAVAEVDGRVQIVLNVVDHVAGFDPDTGEELWRIPAAKDYVSTSPVVVGDRVYYSLRNTHNGMRTMALQLTADGAKPLWETPELGAVVGTPLVVDGRMYFSMLDGRTPHKLRRFYCLNADTGEVIYQSTPDPLPQVVYASPILAGDKIYYQSQERGVYVFSADGRGELVARNVLEDTHRRGTATLVPLGDDALLVRIDEMLYCVSEDE